MGRSCRHFSIVPTLFLFTGLAFVATAPAQSAPANGTNASPGFDPAVTFAPLTLPQPVNRYRSSNGAPGPDYWQNRANYEIHAKLDPDSKTLTGDEVITYTNNSPDTLHVIWLQLDQNIHRRGARADYSSSRPRTKFTDGYQLEQVSIVHDGSAHAATYLVDDTRMRIQLEHPLAPNGASLQLHIKYHFTVPGRFGGRTAWADSPNGPIFDITQWYPRLAVYDDLRGWNTLPFVGSEFYLEYGDFDYYVTVPWDMIVAGSGALQNPKEVLTKTQRERLDEARHSDKTVMIRRVDEIGKASSRPVNHGDLTWHFRMNNTRDVAFTASRAYAWDAAAMHLPNDRTALAMSFYPAESAGHDAWGRSTEYVKHAVEQMSKRWYPYPWPAAINVAGPVEGMEYPGIVFDGIPWKGKELFWVTAHEIGHSWFPMIVGSNERRDAFMDEGFNTFIDVYESDDFEGGVYGPKRDSEYAPGGGNPVDEIVPLLEDPNAPIIMSLADSMKSKYTHPVSYFKTALGLVLLREQILGPKRFDLAFRTYIADWAYKHPSPSDFFRTMESVAGEDLSWFWRGWFMHNWTLDLAVDKATYADNKVDKGLDVTIANLDPLVMPCVVQVELADGSHVEKRVPADAFMHQTTVKLHFDTTQPAKSVTIDPAHVIPDKDRSNNVLQVAAANG